MDPDRAGYSSRTGTHSRETARACPRVRLSDQLRQRSRHRCAPKSGAAMLGSVRAAPIDRLSTLRTDDQTHCTNNNQHHQHHRSARTSRFNISSQPIADHRVHLVLPAGSQTSWCQCHRPPSSACVSSELLWTLELPSVGESSASSLATGAQMPGARCAQRDARTRTATTRFDPHEATPPSSLLLLR